MAIDSSRIRRLIESAVAGSIVRVIVVGAIIAIAAGGLWLSSATASDQASLTATPKYPCAPDKCGEYGF